jgi:hypothetical protein
VATFALVNLLLISQLLAVLEDRPVWEVVQESSKLSTLIFLGNSAVGLIGVVLWLREPVALPAVLLPAATLWLAYRAAERQMQERDRFQHLYEVGQAFASSLVPEVLPNVLPKVARLFGAEEAHLLFAQGGGRPFGAIHGREGSASARPTRPTWPPSACSARGAARWWAGPARPPPAGASCWSRPWSPRAGTWA